MKKFAFNMVGIILILFFSCESDKKIKNCVEVPSIKKHISFTFTKDTVVAEIGIYGNGSYRYGDGFVNDVYKRKELFSALEKNINTECNVNGEIVSYVFYVPGLAEKQEYINSSDILGISVYYIENEKLYHALFVRNNEGDYQFISELNGETSGLITNINKTIAMSLLANIKTEEVSAYHFAHAEDEELFNTARENSKEKLNALCKKYLRKMNNKSILLKN